MQGLEGGGFFSPEVVLAFDKKGFEDAFIPVWLLEPKTGEQTGKDVKTCSHINYESLGPNINGLKPLTHHFRLQEIYRSHMIKRRSVPL